MTVPIAPIVAGLIQVAPQLARWVGGDKAGRAADVAVDLAKTVTGATEAALAELQADPDLALQYQTAIIDQQTRLAEAYLADRSDARTRDVEIQRIRGRNLRADILAVGALTAFVAVLAALFWFEIPEGANRESLLILLGALTVILKDVYAFEFGSSRGSKDKADAIAQTLRGRS